MPKPNCQPKLKLNNSRPTFFCFSTMPNLDLDQLYRLSIYYKRVAQLQLYTEYSRNVIESTGMHCIGHWKYIRTRADNYNIVIISLDSLQFKIYFVLLLLISHQMLTSANLESATVRSYALTRTADIHASVDLGIFWRDCTGALQVIHIIRYNWVECNFFVFHFYSLVICAYTSKLIFWPSYCFLFHRYGIECAFASRKHTGRQAYNCAFMMSYWFLKTAETSRIVCWLDIFFGHIFDIFWHFFVWYI